MPKKWWLVRVALLILVAGALSMTAADVPSQSGAIALAADLDAPGAPDDACKIMPECWANADCDFSCGVGLGRCVHNKCPVRICRCG